MYEEKVILVDKTDNKIGLMNKMEAHQKGLLHRAFSIIIFNDKHEMLLQKRASTKYHTPNLWSNTCCSHQRDGENNISAGRRRLKEEMGFDVDLYKFDSFIYKAFFSNGLIEHEYDHILIGLYNDNPKINLCEVDEWKWVNMDWLCNDIQIYPEKYTKWFIIIIDKYFESLKKWKLQ